MDLSELNELNDEEAFDAFLKCCGAETWVERMVDHRPFASEQELFEVAHDFWWSLDRDDWLQAFSAHPKIGDVDSLREKYSSSKDWSEDEQSGVDEADEEVLERLAEANDEYEEKFGYIFIVCASGKSAAEMLEILEGRLDNDPDEEIEIAAAEQADITRLRLEKLLDE